MWHAAAEDRTAGVLVCCQGESELWPIRTMKAMSLRPEFLLSGHPHYCFDQSDAAVRRINLGALRRAGEFTVATLDLAADEARFLKLAD